MFFPNASDSPGLLPLPPNKQGPDQDGSEHNSGENIENNDDDKDSMSSAFPAASGKQPSITQAFRTLGFANTLSQPSAAAAPPSASDAHHQIQDIVHLQSISASADRMSDHEMIGGLDEFYKHSALKACQRQFSHTTTDFDAFDTCSADPAPAHEYMKSGKLCRIGPIPIGTTLSPHKPKKTPRLVQSMSDTVLFKSSIVLESQLTKSSSPLKASQHFQQTFLSPFALSTRRQPPNPKASPSLVSQLPNVLSSKNVTDSTDSSFTILSEDSIRNSGATSSFSTGKADSKNKSIAVSNNEASEIMSSNLASSPSLPKSTQKMHIPVFQ